MESLPQSGGLTVCLRYDWLDFYFAFALSVNNSWRITAWQKRFLEGKEALAEYLRWTDCGRNGRS